MLTKSKVGTESRIFGNKLKRGFMREIRDLCGKLLPWNYNHPAR